MTRPTQTDPELQAMSTVLEALNILEKDAQERVLDWVSSKLELSSISAKKTERAPTEEPTIKLREGTINTVCARLGVKSCRDLFIASAIHLTLFEGKERFGRGEWVENAKDSKNWKTDYSPQMATTITRLLNSGFVNEVSKEQYAIPDEQLRQHETRFGD